MTPAITIGIMTHNYGRYIQEAIESVITQSRTDWELIISDDASTDNTAEIVAPYLSDPRIRYVCHETNLGQGGNWGYLLEQGTAPILAVLHADDAWLPGTLETVVNAFESDQELDMFYGNWWRKRDGAGSQILAKAEDAHMFTGEQEFLYQAENNTCLPSATFLTRRVVRETEPPSTTLKMVLDYEYFLRIALKAKRVKAVSEPLMNYRVHPNNASAIGRSNSATQSDLSLGLLHLETLRLPEICRTTMPFDSTPCVREGVKLVRKHSGRSLFSSGVNEAIHGSLKVAKKLMALGIQMSPDLLSKPIVLVDYVVCHFGRLSLPIIKRLHPRRVSA